MEINEKNPKNPAEEKDTLPEELAEEVTVTAEAEDVVATLQGEIEKLKKEAKEKDDRYLRMAAEYDNFRRRSREEKEGVYDSAVSDTLSALLPVIDNLERAAQFGGDGEKVTEGLAMIAKSVASALSSLGIEEVGTVGDIFDPNLHNAVMHIEDESFREGEIVEVFQKGYKRGKRIIRFAAVKTAN